jgi:hypothetical protein
MKMPDITMCVGGSCPLKNDCYRFRALPSPHRQSFFMNVPYSKDQCMGYWPLDRASGPITELKPEES